MKVGWIILIAMIFNTLSCSICNDKFDMVGSKGLEMDNLNLATLLFYNNDTGFVAGSSDIVTHNPDFPEKDSNQFAFVTRTALLFKTTDGGRNWIKRDFGEGVILDIIQTDNKIFAVKVCENSRTYFIYSSNDLGENWAEEEGFPKRLSQLFSIDSGYLATVSDSSLIKTYIEASYDFGKSWKFIKSTFLVLDAVMRGNNLLFLSSVNDDEYKKNTLVEEDIKDGVEKVIELPQEFTPIYKI